MALLMRVSKKPCMLICKALVWNLALFPSCPGLATDAPGPARAVARWQQQRGDGEVAGGEGPGGGGQSEHGQQSERCVG